jgi:hypothetical protein
MNTLNKLKIGDRVRPANDGEDSMGRILRWTRLTGTVVDAWMDLNEQRVQVRWDRRSPYPWRLESSWLTRID